MGTFTKESGNWKHNISSAGTITISTAGKYVDKNIVISTASGGCTVSGGGLSKGAASGGGLSGGGLTKGNGAVAGTNVTLSDTNTSGVLVKGSGTVSRAAVTRAAFSQTVTRADIKDAHTAGYIPKKDATTVISSASETVSLAADNTTIGATSLASNEQTKYVTGITLGKGYQFDITNDVSDKVTVKYDSTCNCLDFIFV